MSATRIILIFLWVYAAMVAMAFWEAYVEGRNAWDKAKLGWKFRVGRKFVMTAYHFYLAWVMLPLLMSLPLVVVGWDRRLFGVLLSAYASGIVLEDFMWYVVNPVVKLSEFNSRFADYYPWLKLGRFEVPVFYLFGLAVAVGSWYFLWR